MRKSLDCRNLVRNEILSGQLAFDGWQFSASMAGNARNKTSEDER